MHSEAAGVDPAPAVGGSGMLARHRAGQDRRMRAALSIVLHLEAVGDVNLDVADVCILVKLGALPRQQRQGGAQVLLRAGRQGARAGQQRGSGARLRGLSWTQHTSIQHIHPSPPHQPKAKAHG
jgi:hypothetical protein